MTAKTPITVAYGDGIGPEIMTATLKILDAAGANIEPETIEIGEKVYLAGNSSGIPDDAWQSLERTRLLLKAPITTPQGGGYKSLNVTIRKSLGLYANVRPCRALSPFVSTHFPAMDVVVVRENEEDLYAGIEYRQTNSVYQGLKLISSHGSERIIRFAFEYARKFNRKKVTCMMKDNIMKMTDGIFHRLFKEIGQEYSDLDQESYLIDIGAARIATDPERFDVIVTQNLYGDIISDITAQLAGSVGMAGSANIGDDIAMFEAIHGSAPDIAGQGIANPSGLLNGAIMLLVHIGDYQAATVIHNAWLTTLEQGAHTADIFAEEHSAKRVTTQEFADEVIARLGQKPKQFTAVEYQANNEKQGAAAKVASGGQQPLAEKQLVGTDVYIDLPICGPAEIAAMLAKIDGRLQLQIITNRGVKVWPHGRAETYCSDHWRCRFIASEGEQKYTPTTWEEILHLLKQVTECGLNVIKIENLYTFDGELGFTLAQGE